MVVINYPSTNIKGWKSASPPATLILQALLNQLYLTEDKSSFYVAEDNWSTLLAERPLWLSALWS